MGEVRGDTPREEGDFHHTRAVGEVRRERGGGGPPHEPFSHRPRVKGASCTYRGPTRMAWEKNNVQFQKIACPAELACIHPWKVTEPPRQTPRLPGGGTRGGFRPKRWASPRRRWASPLSSPHTPPPPARQAQFPSVVPGRFMRASLSRPMMSCSGMMQVAATEAMPPSISAHGMSASREDSTQR